MLEEKWITGGLGVSVDSDLKAAGLVDGSPSAEAKRQAVRAVLAFASSWPGCVYLNASHHGLGNLNFFLKLQHVLGGGFVFFVHDLIPIELPEYVRTGDDVEHSRRIRNVLELGARVIANSSATSDTLAVWAQQQGLPAPKTTVAHIGVEKAFLEAGREFNSSSDDRPSFVCVGTIEPRKNHISLLHIWRHFAGNLPAEKIPQLVLVGKRGWECEHVFSMLDRCKALRAHVKELSNVNDAALISTIRSAKALLFPSFAEGWGMPLVEALTLGVPVICSDIPVFREASQGLAEFVDPLDAATWRDRVLARSLESESERQLQQSQTVLFKPPTWARHFETVDPFIIEAMKIGSRRVAPRYALPRVDSLAEEQPNQDCGEIVGGSGEFDSAVFEADTHRDSKRWEEAVASYRTALRIQPSNAGIFVQLGHALKESGKITAAYDAYRRALSLTPSDADLHLQVGHLFKLAGLVNQAFAYYEMAWQLDPNLSDAAAHLTWAKSQISAVA
jgi:glycosyltransferase involved in cell wall biosynthesis